MLQRIQSVFLFLAATCAGLTWLFPVRTWSMGKPGVQFMTYGLFTHDGIEVADISLPLPYHLIQSLLAVVLLVSAFLYGNRQRQARLVRGTWLVTGLVGVMQFISCNSIDSYLAEGTKSTASYGVSLFLPIGTILFAILAERAIRKDEALVRSADRLR